MWTFEGDPHAKNHWLVPKLELSICHFEEQKAIRIVNKEHKWMPLAGIRRPWFADAERSLSENLFSAQGCWYRSQMRPLTDSSCIGEWCVKANRITRVGFEAQASVEYLPSMCKVSGLYSPSQICISVMISTWNPSTQDVEDQEFKIFLYYIVNSCLAWNTWDLVPINK